MNPRNLVYGETGPRRAFSLVLFCAWASLVAILAWNHVVWRDEVRAYSFALQGSNLFVMLRDLHGEGHPALWYFLIRAGHAVVPHPQVLLIIAFLVAFAAMLLLVLRSPFSLPALVLLLSGRFALWEYSVMARNYGISMLLLFIVAAVYPRHRDRGMLLGVLLFLLANTNVHSVLLVGAFLVFWLLDLLLNSPAPRGQVVRNYLLNAAIAICGIVVCAVTVLPANNDSGKILHPAGITLQSAIFFLFLVASTLGLIRRPAALVGAWVGLIGFAVFFTKLYPGLYRHEALWLIFLVSMYWIASGAGRPDTSTTSKPPAPIIRILETAGYASFLLLLTVQTLAGLAIITPFLRHTAPESRSRDLGQLISQTPELHDAILIADPDDMLEALPYYLPNPTYLLREHRFGNIVHFTNKATLHLTLDDIINQAQQLHADTGKPVVILLTDRLNPSAPAQLIPEAYDWTLSTTPDQVRRFLASTHLIKSLAPVPFSDESYDVYLVN